MLLPDPLDFSKICAISKPSREKRRMWTAGKKYSPSSFATDRPDSRSIRPTMTLHRRAKSKECFLQLDRRGEEECPSSALFICQRNVLHLIPNHCSLCFTMQSFVRGRRRRGPKAGPRRAIKWFSRPSTSGWQCDKISSFSSSLSRITISREMKKFFWCERSHRFRRRRRRVECVWV